MFKREKHEVDDDNEVDVDVTLEMDLDTVEQSIGTYLSEPTDQRRSELLAVLERLDQQIDLSDDYENSIVGSAAFGYSPKGNVIGETNSASAAEEVPKAVLKAQTVLVKAAKREVTAPTPQTLAELGAANQALSAARTADSPPQ